MESCIYFEIPRPSFVVRACFDPSLTVDCAELSSEKLHKRQYSSRKLIGTLAKSKMYILSR